MILQSYVSSSGTEQSPPTDIDREVIKVETTPSLNASDTARTAMQVTKF